MPDDDLKDSWWERRKHDVAMHKDKIKWAAEKLSWVATGLAIASMFIPGVNLIVAAALLTAVALAAHTTLAATGNGSWADVALDAFALATFGAGRLLTSGGRVLGQTVKGAKPAMAALRTKAAPRVANAAKKAMEKATSAQRKVIGLHVQSNPAARALHDALKLRAKTAGELARARTLADKLVGYSPLGRLKAADAELGQMLATLKALKPHAAHASVVGAYQEAQAAVRLAQAPAVAGAVVDIADKFRAFDGVKDLPVFNHQPGGSW